MSTQEFIYMRMSESRSEYECETLNGAKYSTGSKKKRGSIGLLIVMEVKCDVSEICKGYDLRYKVSEA
jgi:hypothetical protein